tara:strand:- start:7882 stop:9519 length:1638 start_codon:yes stop_codon:yes gene_type:complete
LIYTPDHPDFWNPEVFLPMLRIRTKSGKVENFNLWSHQRILAVAVMKAYAERKWLCHVKPRQEGSSTFFTGVLYQHVAFRSGCYAGIVAHKREAAEKLARIAIRYHQTCPKSIRPAKTPGLKRTLEFPREGGGDSLMTTASTKDDEPLRGDTAQVVLATEISSWEGRSGEDAWASVLNAVPEEGGIVFAESTPKYFGDQLHKIFEDSHRQGSKWLSVFIPWTMVEEYRKIPPIGWKPRLEVLDYANSNGLTKEQAFWMQTSGLPKCRNNLATFHAEYPINEVDCFGLAGDPVFDADKLMFMLKKMDGGTGILEEIDEYQEFVGPKEGHRYIVCVDPASSWSKKDKFGLEILDLYTCEQVAEFEGHTDAFSMSKMIAKLAFKYNKATVYVEANGVGDAVLSHLLSPTIDYPKVYHRTKTNVLSTSTGGTAIPGWWASSQSKSAAISFLQELIADDSITIHSQRLIRQLVQYRGQWDKLSRDAHGGHYDLTAAFSLAAWAYRHESQKSSFNRKKTQSELRTLAFDKLLEKIEGAHNSEWNTRWGKHI